MHILERYPNLQSLTAWEVEGLAQGILTDFADELPGDADGSLRRTLDVFCAERDGRGEAIDAELAVGLYEPRLTPHPNEEQRGAIFTKLENELRKLPAEARLAAALELYDFARWEEGPMDPVLLAELQLRIEEAERHPEKYITMEEFKRRMEAFKKQLQSKRKPR